MPGEAVAEPARAAGLAWRVAAADAVGAFHIARQMRHEDAWAVAPASALDRDENSVVVAVADGHGHARHFRSAHGAEIAVAVAAELGTAAAAEIAGAGDAVSVEETLRQRVAPIIVAAWRDHVRRDLEENPVTDEERSAAGLGANASFEDLIYGYGATLLVAIAARSWLGCLQLGDGDLFVIAPDGSVRRPVPFDPRLDGRRTTSLCQPDAIDSIRYGVVKATAQPVGAVMLATDGFGNAQFRDDWDTDFGAALAKLAAQNGTAWVGKQLPDWVRNCASADGSGDDATAVLLFAADARWRDKGGGQELDSAEDVGAAAPTVRAGEVPATATVTATAVSSATALFRIPAQRGGARHRAVPPQSVHRPFLRPPVRLIAIAVAVVVLIAVGVAGCLAF
jgi:hypothetical protein